MGCKRVARSIGARLNRCPFCCSNLSAEESLTSIAWSAIPEALSASCQSQNSELLLGVHSSDRCQEHSKFLACITFHRFGKRRSASNTATMTNARIPIKKSVVIRDSLIVPKGRINKQRIPPRCSVRRKNCHGADLGRTEPVGGNERRR